MAQGLSAIASAFRMRDFRFLWSGQFISSFGNVFLEVAALWLLQLRSPAYLAAAGAAMGIPAILAAFGGTLVDHFGARRLMIMTDVVRTAGVGGMAILVALRPAGTPAFLLVALFLTSLGGSIFGPAEMAIMPQTVREEDLASANGLWQSAYSGSRAVGYALGGAVILAAGAVTVLGFDALTYAASALSLLLIRAGNGAIGPRNGPVFSLRGVRETVEAMRSVGWFLPTLPLLIAVNFIGTGAYLMLPYWVHHQLGGSAADYGFLMAALAVGAIVGPLAAGLLGRTPTWIAVAVAEATQSLLYVAFALFPGVLSDTILLGLASAVNTLSNALLFTLMQKKVPKDMHGRAFGLLVTAVTIGTPLGPVLTGLTATSLPLWWPWIATALLGLAFAWRVAKVPELHDTGSVPVPA